jgi:acid phosphatase (class A)
MRKPVLVALFVCVGLLAGAGPQRVTAQAASPDLLLSATATDPVRLLPPPPPEGSDQQKAELAELRHLQETRTPSEFALANWDNLHEDPSAFAPTLGPAFDMASLPATAHLLEIVRREESAAKKQAKTRFQRLRPWMLDAGLVGCDPADDKPNSSYPSGHTTMAFAMAVVLADLIPDRAADLLARAQQYGEDRLVCGVHFRSDIAAGQTLGTAIGAELLQTPALQPDLEAARRELIAAGLAR